MSTNLSQIWPDDNDDDVDDDDDNNVDDDEDDGNVDDDKSLSLLWAAIFLRYALIFNKYINLTYILWYLYSND